MVSLSALGHSPEASPRSPAPRTEGCAATAGLLWGHLVPALPPPDPPPPTLSSSSSSSDAPVAVRAAPAAGRRLGGGAVQLGGGRGVGGESAGFAGESELPQGVQGVHLGAAQQVALTLQSTGGRVKLTQSGIFFVFCIFARCFVLQVLHRADYVTPKAGDQNVEL